MSLAPVNTQLASSAGMAKDESTLQANTIAVSLSAPMSS